MLCSVCKKTISRTKKGVKCSSCRETFHALCVNISDAVLEDINKNDLSWSCSSCKRSSTTNNSVAINSEDDSDDDFADIKKSMDLFSLELKALRLNQTEFSNSLDSINQKFDNFIKLTKIVENQGVQIKQLEEENFKLNKQVTTISNRLEILEDNTYKANLILHGIPDDSDEVTQVKVEQVLKALEVSSCIREIKNITRVHHNKKVLNDDSINPILIECDNILTKKKIFDAVKAKKIILDRNLFITDLGFNTHSGKLDFFVTDHLTKFKQNLLFKARQLKADKVVQFVWVQINSILAKKTVNSKIIKIYSDESINKLRNSI